MATPSMLDTCHSLDDGLQLVFWFLFLPFLSHCMVIYDTVLYIWLCSFYISVHGLMMAYLLQFLVLLYGFIKGSCDSLWPWRTYSMMVTIF